MAGHGPLVKSDLRYKHQQMKSSPFPFMRATFYRWVQLWKQHSAALNRAPQVLGVGDLHVENFGTWRDSEGRLVWGVNDFDEACAIPYTNDLVRLTTSVYLAIREDHLTIRRRDAARLILQGYVDRLRAGGKPFVLDENHMFIRNIALAELRDPVHFWGKMRTLPSFKGRLSAEQREAIELLLPQKGVPYRVVTRRAGLGSLGRVRLVALAEWRGSLLAREIKAMLPSAWNGQTRYGEIIENRVRIPDPYVQILGKWIVRRLAPDCSRIELWTLPKKSDEERMLHAMGAETANIHLGSRAAARAIPKDIKRRPADWLHKSAKVMSDALIQDWKTFSGK
jgi:hypothetical protein